MHSRNIKLSFRQHTVYQSKREKNYNELLSKIRLTKEQKLYCAHNALANEKLSLYHNTFDKFLSNCIFKEGELREYYDDVSNRLYDHSRPYDDDIEKLAQENIDYINTLQENLTFEIAQCKEEMESYTVEQFNIHLSKQEEVLEDYIKKTRFMFEVTEKTAEAIAKIKGNFANMNNEIQKELEANRELRIRLDLIKKENKLLCKKLLEQKTINESLSNRNIDKGNRNSNSNVTSNDQLKSPVITNTNVSVDKFNKTNANANSNILSTWRNTNTSRNRKSNTNIRINTDSISNSKRLFSPVSHHKTTFSFNTEEAFPQMTESNAPNDSSQLFISPKDINQMSITIQEQTVKAEHEYRKKFIRNNKLKHKREQLVRIIEKGIEDLSYEYSHLCSNHNQKSESYKSITKAKLTEDLEFLTYIYDNWLSAKNNLRQILKSKSCNLRFKKKK